jgi:hypothetical protein
LFSALPGIRQTRTPGSISLNWVGDVPNPFKIA